MIANTTPQVDGDVDTLSRLYDPRVAHTEARRLDGYESPKDAR